MAFSKLGGLSDGDMLTNEQYALGSRWLNIIVRNWTGEDIFLWKINWITQALSASSVALASDGWDYECIRNHASSAITEPGVGVNYTSCWKRLTTATGDAWVTGTVISHLILIL